MNYPQIQRIARSVARRVPGDVIDADDLAQESAVKTLGGRKGKVEWPMIDLLRKESPRAELLDVAATEPGLECVLMNRVRLAISSLGHRDRAILNMSFWEGRSRREIMSGLGIGKSRVNQLHRRAIRRLQSHMGIVPSAPLREPTQAEMKVWRAYIFSETRTAACESLGISPKTFEVHLYNLRKKLGVSGRNSPVKLTRLWFERASK